MLTLKKEIARDMRMDRFVGVVCECSIRRLHQHQLMETRNNENQWMNGVCQSQLFFSKFHLTVYDLS
jgi:hypothetical protein